MAALDTADIYMDVEMEGVNVIRVSSDYSTMLNKPTINGVVVEGDKTLEDYGFIPGTAGSYSNLTDKPSIGGVILEGDKSLEDLGIVPGSGEGGTLDYNQLSNKPSIGGVVLEGDMAFSDLNLSLSDVGYNLADDSQIDSLFD